MARVFIAENSTGTFSMLKDGLYPIVFRSYASKAAKRISVLKIFFDFIERCTIVDFASMVQRSAV